MCYKCLTHVVFKKSEWSDFFGAENFRPLKKFSDLLFIEWSAQIPHLTLAHRYFCVRVGHTGGGNTIPRRPSVEVCLPVHPESILVSPN